MRLIEVFCEFGSRTEKLTVFPKDTGYFFQTRPELQEGEVDSGAVVELIAVLSMPEVSEEDGLQQHDWPRRQTGAMPFLLVRFTDENSQTSWLRSSSDAIYMLPLQKLRHPGFKPAETYDHNLSLALANLLPEGFTNRHILLGQRKLREDSASESTPSAVLPGVAFEDVLAQARQQGHDPARRLLLPIENSEVAKILARGAPPDAARDGFGETALMQAVRRSDGERAGLLLEAGVDPNVRSKCGGTPLHVAHDYDVAMKLIAAGANLNQPGQDGTTPLMMAVSSRKPELVELLLLSGANPETTDGEGWTALTVAVERRDAEMVRLLLKFGAKKEPAVARAQYAVRHASLKKEINEAALEFLCDEDRIRLHAETLQILGAELSAELDKEFDEDVVLERCLEVERLLR